MNRLALGLTLVLAKVGFSATSSSSINPICSVVQALADNADVIIWLIVGMFAVIVMGVGIMELAAGKAHRTLVVVLGGAVILVATYRLLDTGKSTLKNFASQCGGGSSSAIELVKYEK
jgi:hypothetical protein